MNEQWPAWRLVHAGWATLTELRTTWTLGDLFDANHALDAAQAAEARAAKK